ncbi:MAG: sugar ABC transporter substrate-binding protein, partial [Chloroflexota bacterium]|nr:sugar ABC transporter substrate-binding protein [Chloroflexota bacterium]
IFVLPYRYFAQFSARGTLEPLGPWLAKSPMIKAADFYPQALESFSVNGTLQCMPLTIASANIYYNKDMFQKAGVPFPHTGWTWQEFLRAAQAMTKPGQYGLGVEPELDNLAPFIWQHGGELVDDPTHPTQLTLNTPATRSAIQYFINLSQAYRVVPSETDMQAEALETRWDANQIGMIIGNRSDTARFRRTKGFTWDVATLPSDVTAAGNLKSEAYCVSAKSKNKAAAWDFVQWASSPDAQALLAKTGRTVPTLQSVATSSAFLDPTQAPAHPQIYLDAIPTLRHVPNTAAWPEIESAFNAELERAFFTSVPLDTALNAITEQGNAALARVNK